MEIKLELDEATIIRKAMEGLTKKQIQDWAITEAKEQAHELVRSAISKAVFKMSNKWNSEADQLLVKTMAKEVRTYFTSENLKKEFKKEDWSKLFENVVSPILGDFIEQGLNEWLALEISVGKPNKRKTITLCGKDSYTHRRR